MSGDTVIAKISGETIVSTISGNVVVTSVSGNAVNLSGQGVWVSGTVVTSVSGNAVIFSGQGVWVSGSVSVSGNAVTSSGDTYIAKTSGETIRLVLSSGLNGVYLVNQSGNTIVPVINPADNLSVNTFTLYTTAYIGAVEGSTAKLNRLRSTTSGLHESQSGIVFRLLTCISGDPVKVSGETISTSISGNTVNNAAQTITAPAWLAITGASGGTTLAAQACTMVRLQNLSGNGTMLVGGIGSAAPVSGTKGIALWPSALSTIGTELDFPVTNANLISVVAHTSGNNVAYMTFG